MVNKKDYYNKRYKKKAQSILDDLGMEDDQMEFFMMLPMSDQDLYELALVLKDEVEESEEHLSHCKGCDKCKLDTKVINEN